MASKTDSDLCRLCDQVDLLAAALQRFSSDTRKKLGDVDLDPVAIAHASDEDYETRIRPKLIERGRRGK